MATMMMAAAAYVAKEVPQETQKAMRDAIGHAANNLLEDTDNKGPVPKDGFQGPYFVLYRSNNIGSGMNEAGGLVVESTHASVEDAICAFKANKGHWHGYGVVDSTGKVIVFNATSTTSFQPQYCAEAVKVYRDPTRANATASKKPNVKKLISDAIGPAAYNMLNGSDSMGLVPPEGFKAPFYVIYRSNMWGSGANSAGGLVAESTHASTEDAIKTFNNRKGGVHGYGVVDSNGMIIVFNATSTCSFQPQYCAKAVRNFEG